jgi:hypothetical protein
VVLEAVATGAMAPKVPATRAAPKIAHVPGDWNWQGPQGVLTSCPMAPEFFMSGSTLASLVNQRMVFMA